MRRRKLIRDVSEHRKGRDLASARKQPSGNGMGTIATRLIEIEMARREIKRINKQLTLIERELNGRCLW